MYEVISKIEFYDTTGARLMENVDYTIRGTTLHMISNKIIHTIEFERALKPNREERRKYKNERNII